jgi:soluble lytic murein transglycosylase-like protein
MRRNNASDFAKLACALTAAWVCLAASPLRAQEIVLVDDGHGHKVYVNVESPPPQPAGARQSSLRQIKPPEEINKLVQDSAERHQVDPRLVRAVIQVESDYDPHAVSNKGAMGLMQLIPATAQRFGVQNPYSAKQNIEGGVNYLKYLLNLFNGDVTLSLAAYNAGENTVMRRGGVPPIPETVDYVRKVRSLYDPGSKSGPLAAKSKQEIPVTIYRYVDASGVVHYTDGGDL